MISSCDSFGFASKDWSGGSEACTPQMPSCSTMDQNIQSMLSSLPSESSQDPSKSAALHLLPVEQQILTQKHSDVRNTLKFDHVDKNMTIKIPCNTVESTGSVRDQNESSKCHARFVFGNSVSDVSESLNRTESDSWKRKSRHLPSSDGQEHAAEDLKRRRCHKTPSGSSKPMEHRRVSNIRQKKDTQLIAEKELDSRRLEQRQKQIDFGKNTLGYDEYSRHIPK
jgi:hypothetical protein